MLAYPRFFIQTAEKAKLPTLLFDADFKVDLTGKNIS